MNNPSNLFGGGAELTPAQQSSVFGRGDQSIFGAGAGAQSTIGGASGGTAPQSWSVFGGNAPEVAISLFGGTQSTTTPFGGAKQRNT